MKARPIHAALDRTIDRIVAEAAEALPVGVGIERAPEGIRLTGRGIVRRWMTDTTLRAFALMAGRGRQ